MKTYYQRKYIQHLKALARAHEPNLVSLSHVLPRCYCVAKPNAHFAVLVCPPCDREPQVAQDTTITVHHSSAQTINVGDWAAVGYVATPTWSEIILLEKLTS